MKNFDEWNKLKKLLDKRNIIYCHEKEIWWCSLGLNIGYEEDGKNVNFERPVLVLKKFNKDILWILPTTSRIKTNRFYYKVYFKGKYSSIILSQIRVVSSKRLLRRIARIEKEEFRKIKKSIINLFLN